MDPLTVITSVAPLIIDWVKERRKRNEDVSEQAFKAWFSQSAIPELHIAIDNSFQALAGGQKAHHRELVDYLEQQFSGVHEALAEFKAGQPRQPTFAGKWTRLETAGQDLLQQLHALVAGDTYEHAQIQAPLIVQNAKAAEVEEGAKRIHEARLVKRQPYTGSETLRLTGLGFLVACAANSAEAFQRDLARIQNGLREYPSCNVGKLVADSKGNSSPAFIYAVIERWWDLGFIQLTRLDQRGLSRISRPTQQLLDADVEELVGWTLLAFVQDTAVA